MLDNQKIQNNWPAIKTQVLNKWNKLSDAEVEKTHGDSSSLSKLVESKYGEGADFDTTYDEMIRSLSQTTKRPIIAKNDIENRDPREPSAEAGLSDRSTERQPTERAFNETMKSGSPERRLNSNYAKVESDVGMKRQQNDEFSADPKSSRVRVGDFEEENEQQNLNDSDKADTKFTTPDEFYPSQDPTPSREDITLGRNTSSATNLSTAKAASKSSEVSSNDAKRKL